MDLVPLLRDPSDTLLWFLLLVVLSVLVFLVVTEPAGVSIFADPETDNY